MPARSSPRENTPNGLPSRVSVVAGPINKDCCATLGAEIAERYLSVMPSNAEVRRAYLLSPPLSRTVPRCVAGSLIDFSADTKC